MRTEDLVAEIQGEVCRYREGLDRVGTSVPIVLLGDHTRLTVRASGLLRLCSALLTGGFSRWDVHYICDALSLSDAIFTSERLRDLVEELANPETRLNDLSDEEVLVIRNELVSLGGE